MDRPAVDSPNFSDCMQDAMIVLLGIAGFGLGIILSLHLGDVAHHLSQEEVFQMMKQQCVCPAKER